MFRAGAGSGRGRSGPARRRPPLCAGSGSAPGHRWRDWTFPTWQTPWAEPPGASWTTWSWKDDVHFERKAHYGKIIRRQPSFIAPEYLPDFIAALAGRGLQVERDPARLYAEGRLPRVAHVIAEDLRGHGRASSGELRRLAGAQGFDRALVELQQRLVICKVDVAGHTRGTYAYVWDLTERFWPEAFREAAGTAPQAARARIRGRLREFGIEPTPVLESRLFLWKPM